MGEVSRLGGLGGFVGHGGSLTRAAERCKGASKNC
jgi:hypothetical protein